MNAALNLIPSINAKIAIVQTPLQSIFTLLARLYVGWIFFASGLTKIRDWDSTLMLFEYEYNVPFLDFEVAAYLATAGELILPVMLAIGLFSRFSAVGLAIVNIVAVISLEDIAPAAFNEHVIWGLLLLQVIVWGADKLSVDHFVIKKLRG